MATFDHDFDQREANNHFLAITFPCYYFRQKAFVAWLRLRAERLYLFMAFAWAKAVRRQGFFFIVVAFFMRKGLRPFNRRYLKSYGGVCLSAWAKAQTG